MSETGFERAMTRITLETAWRCFVTSTNGTRDIIKSLQGQHRAKAVSDEASLVANGHDLLLWLLIAAFSAIGAWMFAFAASSYTNPSLNAAVSAAYSASPAVASFNEIIFATGLTAPTAMEFAPDGRLFVASKEVICVLSTMELSFPAPLFP